MAVTKAETFAKRAHRLASRFAQTKPTDETPDTAETAWLDGLSQIGEDLGLAPSEADQLADDVAYAYDEAEGHPRTPTIVAVVEPYFDARAGERRGDGSQKSRNGDSNLYDIAEDVQKENRRRYKNVHFFEELIPGRGVELRFPVDPAYAVISPSNGTWIVELTWPYQTEWGETESADVEMGRYKTPKRAVRRAFEIALWSEDVIRDIFARS